MPLSPLEVVCQHMLHFTHKRLNSFPCIFNASQVVSFQFFSIHCSSTICVYVAKVCGQYVTEKISLLPMLKRYVPNNLRLTCFTRVIYRLHDTS